jgi:hypothetical protein
MPATSRTLRRLIIGGGAGVASRAGAVPVPMPPSLWVTRCVGIVDGYRVRLPDSSLIPTEIGTGPFAPTRFETFCCAADAVSYSVTGMQDHRAFLMISGSPYPVLGVGMQWSLTGTCSKRSEAEAYDVSGGSTVGRWLGS